jgi:uncharacterized membrane protein
MPRAPTLCRIVGGGKSADKATTEALGKGMNRKRIEIMLLQPTAMRLIFRAMFACLALMAATLQSGAALADFLICNQSSAPEVNAAFGYYEKTNGWTSAGWLVIPKGSCEAAWVGELENTSYYFYAVKDDMEWAAIGGQQEALFCIDPNKPFTLHTIEHVRTADNVIDCAAHGYVQKNFRQIDVGNNRNYTYNLQAPGVGTASAGGTTLPGRQRGAPIGHDPWILLAVAIGGGFVGILLGVALGRASARPLGSGDPSATRSVPDPGASGVERGQFRLHLSSGRIIDLVEGAHFNAQDFGVAGSGAIAEIAANPKDLSVLGLKNLSGHTWSATTSRGEPRTVEPRKSIRLEAGTKIDFGALKGDIVSQAH